LLKGYRKEWWDRFWSRVEKMPKRLLIITLFVGTQIFNIRDLVEYISRRSKAPVKIETPKPRTITDTVGQKK